MTGLLTFRRWQERYAEHGIATFPVGQNKRPLIRNWQRVGLNASAQLATGRFADEAALAVQCGKYSGLLIIDIDTDEEQAVKEALQVFGSSPVIYRTGSGHFAIAYRYNGEKRRIHPLQDLPIDILGGGGFAIVPPSLTTGVYRFLRGGLADLDRLPVARIDKIAPPEASRREIIPKGRRDDTIFRRLLREVHYCDDLDALLDVARTLNMDCDPPLPDTQIIAKAKHVWKMETTGNNWVRRKARATTDRDEIIALSHDPRAALLLSLLRVSHPISDAEFAIDRIATGKVVGWSDKTIRTCIGTLLKAGRLVRVHDGKGKGDPHLYRLPKAKGGKNYPQYK